MAQSCLQVIETCLQKQIHSVMVEVNEVKWQHTNANFISIYLQKNKHYIKKTTMWT